MHVAVLAVAPWSHYASALQPQFPLDAQDALDKVVRDTSSALESKNRSLGLSAAVTQDPDKSGILRAPDTSSYSQNMFSVPGVGRPDAMLEYWAATSLYQEVQLLNRTVRDAAIPSGYRPYLVRLQISLLPRRRNEPYDAYTTLSFFTPESAPAAAGGGAGDSAGLALQPPATRLRSAPESRRALLPGTGPCVLPLVATDNLEGSQQSRSSQDTQNLALALLGFPGSLAIEGSAQLFQSELQAQLRARDLNSLLTVARLSENSLRVRLGAMQQASARFAMVPRNHYVTLLLMVPEEAPPVVDLVAETTLVDTETGAELEGTSEARIADLFAGVRSHVGEPGLDDATLQQLFERVQCNDQTGYAAALRAKLGGRENPALSHELWLELVQLMAGSQFASYRFELPGHGDGESLPDEFYAQTALLVDDGAEQTTAVLHDATFSERVQVSAALHINVEGREILLPADSIALTERELQLTFPSLAALGLEESARAGARLELSWAGVKTPVDALYVRRAQPGSFGPFQ